MNIHFLEFDYERAKRNGYKPCLGLSDDDKDEHFKNLLHFLYHHRGWSVTVIADFFDEYRKDVSEIVGIDCQLSKYERGKAKIL